MMKFKLKPYFTIRAWSIVTKITIVVCGIVAIFVVLGGVILIKLEFDMTNTFMEKHLEALDESLEYRQIGESVNLKEYIEFIAQILNHAGAEFVFKKDVNAINTLLTPYLKHPAISAIGIVDADEQAFDAMWKDSGFTFFGKIIPEKLDLENSLSVQIELTYYNRPIGTLQIYYSDASLAQKIEIIRQATLKKSSFFTQESNERLRNVIVSQSLGIGAILLILTLCLILCLRIFVRKPLLMIANIAHKLGDFDLTLNISTTRQDEIGRLLMALHDMVQSFRQLISQVQQSGVQVTSSATELSATAKEQEATIAAQVNSTSKVLNSVQEIYEMMMVWVQAMQQVASKFEETAGFASSGQTDLTHMEDAMQHMENASISISNRLQTINEKTENITTVVTTITRVADQTNLLSLNAAIEAEKAGESGRGFTVVAREIRRLADQTAVATLDIEEMVHQMQAAVSTGVMEMDKFIAEVRRSAEDVELISLQLSKIIEQVQELSPNFAEVNLAMEYQAENAQKINTAMILLSEEMRETKASLHETYSAIEQLNEAASNLHDEVSRFKVN